MKATSPHNRRSWQATNYLPFVLVLLTTSACGEISDSGPGIEACDQGDQQAISPDTGACYMLFTSVQATWEAATVQCQRLGDGAHLATVTDPDEHDLLVRLAGVDTDVWLGGNDIALENVFEWITGEPMGEFGWGMKEPNDGNGDFAEDCMIIRNLDQDRPDNVGTWDDRACDLTYSYICER